MSILDALWMDVPWIGKVVGVADLVAVFGLLWLSYKLEKRGYFKNYSRGLGRGLFEVETMLCPSKQHVREAKEKKLEAEDDQGGPAPKSRGAASREP